ncbi:AadA family aminoglycoside 3''-O-nucleotidyltransferase [Bordetella trematum]|uniref:AadA family aminoglycoside 3''-O-nucleotidyltransferase n=1 Tax=Bordetella trematum TaxID=123899 RepID=UPI003AF34225
MTTESPDSIADQLFETRSVLEMHLEAIRAIHLFGSAVDGGLKPFSDIDLLVTVDAPLNKSTQTALMADLMNVSAFPGTDVKRRALEVTVVALQDVVPWRHPALRQMQFGEWLRDDINAGVFEPAIIDHDLAILLTQVRQHSVALYGPPAHEIFDEIPAVDVQHCLLETLAQWNTEEDWAGDERNIVLTLVRIFYTAMTGKITSKDAAANWALQYLPNETKSIVIAARDAYLGLEAVDLAACPKERENLLSYVRSSVTAQLQKLM